MTMKQNVRRLTLPEAGDALCSSIDAQGMEETHEELDAAQDRFARMCKALAHPARVRIVRFLLSVDTCVCGDIVDTLPLAQSTVSQHLKVLKDAGIIVGTIDGPRTCYCLDRDAVDEFKALSEALL